jgi:hypothetical protein
MSLNREQFWHLYVNANSLSELAIVALGRDWEASGETTAAAPPPTDEQARVADEQLQARLAAQYASADWSALDGLDWDLIGGALRGPRPPSLPSPQPSDPPDMAAGLEQAYARERTLRRHADAAFDLADRAALAAALARLPAELPALTARLPAEALSRWLQAYQAGTPALGTIVASIRALARAVEQRA